MSTWELNFAFQTCADIFHNHECPFPVAVFFYEQPCQNRTNTVSQVEFCTNWSYLLWISRLHISRCYIWQWIKIFKVHSFCSSYTLSHHLVFMKQFFAFSFPLQFFHFSSKAELPKSGQFAGRIKWQGTPARGDVSISLINATLNDNGTYTCDVTNPPDVFDSPKSDTVLTVTPKGKLEQMGNHDGGQPFEFNCLPNISWFSRLRQTFRPRFLWAAL